MYAKCMQMMQRAPLSSAKTNLARFRLFLRPKAELAFALQVVGPHWSRLLRDKAGVSPAVLRVLLPPAEA
jgi:hypothetical protein